MRSFNRRTLVGVTVIPRLTEYKWVSREERIRRQMVDLAQEEAAETEKAPVVQFLLDGVTGGQLGGGGSKASALLAALGGGGGGGSVNGAATTADPTAVTVDVLQPGLGKTASTIPQDQGPRPSVAPAAGVSFLEPRKSILVTNSDNRKVSMAPGVTDNRKVSMAPDVVDQHKGSLAPGVSDARRGSLAPGEHRKSLVPGSAADVAAGQLGAASAAGVPVIEQELVSTC